MKHLFHQCVEGNVIKTYEYLKTLVPKTEEQLELVEKYENRFFKEEKNILIEHEDTWIKHIINTYREYFEVVLTNRVDRLEAERRLLEKLNHYLPIGQRGTNMKTTEDNLKVIFNEKGYSFLGGKVQPHYGPFIWKSEYKKEYIVDLPGATKKVEVRFLDDFLMISWLHFATFGEVYAGGWAGKDALYCVLPNYFDKLDTDAFHVSFLKHEAQHFSDYEQFPKLKGPDLEYRAKLVEIIYYSNLDFFEKLLVQAVNNPNPHNYSAYIILKRFSNHFFDTVAEKRIEKWETIDIEEICQFARELFDEHTRLLEAEDVHTVEGII
ncbi:hypothetical protein [Ferdinandcohnia sp. Marseille-Q9671]